MRLIAAVFFCALLHAQDFSEISGQVVDSATKQPLAGARVVLVRMNPGASYSTRTFDTELSPESPDPAAPIFAFMTDAQGLFRCRTTSPAEFMLFVSRPGYAKSGMSLETQRTISVKAGRTPNQVRVPLDAEGTISGRIVDADTGAPIPGLAVAAFRWRVFDGTRTLMQSGDSTTTNAAGAYEIAGLPPGDYHLQADTPTRGKFSPGGTPEDIRNHREIAYSRSYYPGVELREQSSSVTLLPGATLASIEMKLTRRRLACIRGRLLSAEGESITGEVPVFLGRVERDGDSVNLRSIAMSSLIVGSSFRLDGLPPGRYWLDASLPKGSPQGRHAAYTFFQLDDRNVDDLDLTITTGVAIHGKVTLHESVAGQLSDLSKSGQPPFISINFRDRMSQGEELPVIPLQPDGSFVFQGVMDGTYLVYLAPLPAGLSVGEVRYNGSRQPRALITLNRAAPDQKLELVVYPATASAQVSVTSGSHPAKDAQVALFPEEYDIEDPQSGVRTTRTDAYGHVTFSNLVAGKYRLLAFSPEAAWRTSPSLRNLVATAAKVVDLAAGATVSTDLKQTDIE